LKELTADIKHEPGYRSLRELRASGNANSPLVARVVNIIDRQAELPVIVICCDALGDFFALSLYDTDSSTVANALLPMRSLLKIERAKFREIKLTDPAAKLFCYPSVRVAHLGDVTVVGGGKLNRLAVQSVFSVGAEHVESKSEGTTPCWEKEEQAIVQSIAQEAKNEKVANPADERWILQEDAKRRKEEAHAKAKAKAKAAGKSKRRDRDRSNAYAKSRSGSMVSTEPGTDSQEASDKAPSEGTEDDTRATESDAASNSGNSGKDEQSGCSEVDDILKPSQRVRWADLEVSDNEEDGWLNRGAKAYCDGCDGITASVAVPTS
jgi:hypothetical protein